MVGFPDWANRIGNRFALLAGARAKGEQIPHATTKVGPGKERIENQCQHHRGGDDQIKIQVRQHGFAPPDRPWG